MGLLDKLGQLLGGRKPHAHDHDHGHDHEHGHDHTPEYNALQTEEPPAATAPADAPTMPPEAPTMPDTSAVAPVAPPTGTDTTES